MATVAWTVLLAGFTWVSARDDPPTVREQRTLSQAGPLVDGAIGELVAASDAGVPALAPPEVDRGCRISPFAEGATLVRAVEVAVPVGEERVLLEQVADRLPARWRAGVRLTPDGPRLRADAGEFVTVAGRVVADGRLRLTVDTGCRPVGDGYPGDATGPDGPEASALAEALGALGSPATDRQAVVSAPCPNGGAARTVRSAAGSASTSPPAALAPLAVGTPVVATPELYAYRRDGVAVLADLEQDPILLSATTGCAG
ncbi:hypothetical protein SAMN05443287_11412 [Micromonospora phaseoli]|uniref:Uncharacterized protein n=1 Tax=Micromonospora phaseoli TaxID=1144548 RepID=A0A1H7DGE5_9ACTN|nr:hypothetical protein CLV64_102668 [Micromonospora phaseoli]GIJ75703.1 hypothetical protein Xph01_01350 [Micromonospora phaseoli]SEK00881.1 hypothetical protein SAMN05443287_11412 [Micromonospora phaseoli]